MAKWEIRCVRRGDEEELLKQGYEPFGVSPHNTSYQFFNTSLKRTETEYQTTDYIYLRRRVEES